jgi:serine/threonine-protein kinase RsbW
MSDRVTLTVPSRGEFARTVRMTASELASRMGMSYDDVEDVRLAAEEAFVYAAETIPEDDPVTIEFSVSDQEFELLVGLGLESRLSDEEAERRASYATFILQSVCDRFELSSDDAGAHLRVTKIKGSVPVDVD